METIVSAHKITTDKEFSFDPTIYSKFKYGCVSSTVAMAEELVRTFLQYDRKYNLIDQDTELVIIPYAYRSIPSAATFLAENVKTILNWHLHNIGMNPVSSTKMHRQVVCEPDYGKLSQEERENVLSKEILSLNEEVIKNKFVLFVDDIRVTGAHERVVQKMVNKYSHTAYMHLYYAEAAPSIPPHVEDILNKYAIKHLNNLIEILEGKHYLSARMVKEILRMEERLFNRFLEATNNIDLFTNIVNQSIAEGYDKLPSFKHNFNHLKNILKNEFHKSAQTASNQS
jgi:hypothetical protein